MSVHDLAMLAMMVGGGLIGSALTVFAIGRRYDSRVQMLLNDLAISRASAVAQSRTIITMAQQMRADRASISYTLSNLPPIPPIA